MLKDSRLRNRHICLMAELDAVDGADGVSGDVEVVGVERVVGVDGVEWGVGVVSFVTSFTISEWLARLRVILQKNSAILN